MMNISFESFAYKKKPDIFNILDSDSESSSIQCLDDQDENISITNFAKSKKRRQILIESDSDEDDVVQITKRKRIQISDSEDETNVTLIEDDCEDVQCRSGNESLLDTSQLWGDEKCQLLLSFLVTCTFEELTSIHGCSRKKAISVISKKPFNTYDEMVESLNTIKNFNTEEFLNECGNYLDERSKFEELLKRCDDLSKDIDEQILLQNEKPEDLPIQQPCCVNEKLELKNYQIIGLNWLAFLHAKHLNGILADQMGLGKTIQALTFLGYLLENGNSGPHVIVCPVSCLDNWVREFRKWLPEVSFLQYHGSQSERYHLRMDIIEGQVEADVIISTINLITSSKQDRQFFQKLDIHYLILDEAHMIKNMNTQRYKHLTKLKASRKLLLTGTPLQNDVMELMSLLIFLMPDIFHGYKELLQMLFVNKSSEDMSPFEKELLPKVKKILKPFVLRRLKKDVLKDLPCKKEKLMMCNLTNNQHNLYKTFMSEFSKATAGITLMTNLRKVSNHPLLVRNKYADSKLIEMSQEYAKSPFHSDCNIDYVYEDMTIMSDFQLHSLCEKEISLKKYTLPKDDICDCGKMILLDQMLPTFKQKGDRILIFSQFVIMLDILEEYLKIRNYSFVRLDGQTKGCDRLKLIDQYNGDDDIFIFLLSTRAGGLGINLTTANTVIFYDIDFNPYNDKQAEDRCHRVGQNREVTIYKCISQGTIEENMLKCGEKKLLLEKEIVGNNEQELNTDVSTAVLDMLKAEMNCS